MISPIETTQPDHVETKLGDVPSDKADFDVKHDAPRHVELTVTEPKRTRRKIDPRVVPIVTIPYLSSFLDRGYDVKPSFGVASG